jgi:hypothetical protein
MPRSARIEPFLLVIVDDDQHAFSVVGPMSDDTDWNNRVCAAQDRRGGVRIYTADRSQTRQQIIDQLERSGLKYAPDLPI